MGEETGDMGFGLSGHLFSFLFLGIVLVFAGVIVLVVAAVVLGGSGSAGGVILIGPIPIVFGAGPESTWLILISLMMAALSVAVIVLSRRRRRV
jgi:uncharacterized membrane protein